MRYVLARFRQDDEARAYRIYVCESFRLQGENKYLTISYKDIINPPKKVAEDNRSGDDIAEDIILRMGLKVGETN